jgi:hypothetical protein
MTCPSLVVQEIKVGFASLKRIERLSGKNAQLCATDKNSTSFAPLQKQITNRAQEIL